MPVIYSSSAPAPHNILHFDFLDQWAVRKGDWKLIYKAVDVRPGNYRQEIEDEYFLSNIKEDPSETVNYSKSHLRIVQELKKERKEWLDTLSKE